MIPYDIDPSLYHGQPAPALLDDGFSPPATVEPRAQDDAPADADAAQPAPTH